MGKIPKFEFRAYSKLSNYNYCINITVFWSCEKKTWSWGWVSLVVTKNWWISPDFFCFILELIQNHLCIYLFALNFQRLQEWNISPTWHCLFWVYFIMLCISINMLHTKWSLEGGQLWLHLVLFNWEVGGSIPAPGAACQSGWRGKRHQTPNFSQWSGQQYMNVYE